MRRISNLILVLCLCIASLTSLTACTRMTTAVGYTDKGHIHQSYGYFSGAVRHTIRPDKSETVVFDLKVEKGSLTIRITASDRTIAEEFECDKTEVREVKLPAGKYWVRFEGKDTKGGFDVKWN